jgi:hypothetical protein
MSVAQLQPDSGYDDDLKPKTGPATTAAATTFAQMQQNGQPRPPAPAAPASTAQVPAAQAVPRPTPAAPVQGVVTANPGGVPIPTPMAAPTTDSTFEQSLKDRYTSAQSATAPVFNPSANPFTPTAPTFAPSAGTNQVTGATQQAVLNLLGQPDPYSSDVAKTTYNNLSGAIDDQYNVEDQQIQEEMARRGITASSIYGGRLQDSNAMRKTAKEQLADSILTQQAETNSAARTNAIGAANTVGGQSYSQDASTAQLRDALSRGSFADALSAFQANQAAQNQSFTQGEQAYQDYAGFGQQGFNNQLATTQVNNQETAQYQALLASLLGLQ